MKQNTFHIRLSILITKNQSTTSLTIPGAKILLTSILHET